MSSRTRVSLLAAAAVVIAASGYLYWRAHRELDAARLLRYFPPGDASLLSVDITALRQSGLLRLVAGTKAAEEADYKTFVQQTGFDYQRDLDLLLTSFTTERTYVLAKGRFDWPKLQRYAAQQGGRCEQGVCRVPGSQPGRAISFYTLRDNILALAVAPDPGAANDLQLHENAPAAPPSSQPVWLSLSPATLRLRQEVPAGTRLFAAVLGSAERLLFSVGPEQDRLALTMEASCATAPQAALLTKQLQELTSTLTKLILQAKQKPNSSDLSGMIVAGTFRQQDRQVFGHWPIERTLVESMAGGQAR